MIATGLLAPFREGDRQTKNYLVAQAASLSCSKKHRLAACATGISHAAVPLKRQLIYGWSSSLMTAFTSGAMAWALVDL